MEIDNAASEYHNKIISEAIIEASPNGNGWRILFHKTGGDTIALTDHGGTEKLYHTLDHATDILKSAGIKTIRVEEHF
ncbi:MAG: hypothetical protein KZQ83_09275 [gamma proteobacterium symbiont of Taylorina sp.]|nr:hypothetical protein [gamma proteobacterium symbiont of Taylorina sp.]